MLLESATDLTVRYGEVHYEEMLEQVTVNGYIGVLDGWVLVYGDPDEMPLEQPHTLIPNRRIVKVEIRPAC